MVRAFLSDAMSPRFISLLFLFLTTAPRVSAIEFEADIRPILKQRCFECHSEEKKKEKAGYVFDNIKRFAKDIGKNMTIEPGSPRDSHFYEVLNDDSVKNHMPPKGRISQPELDKIRTWIAEGARLDKNAPKMAVKKDLPPIMRWTNSEGKAIKAGFDKIDGPDVVLKMPDGKYVKYPLAKLSPESQQLAKECAAEDK